MAKRHDEEDDLKILCRDGRFKVDTVRKILRMSKGTDVGIKTWGRIDFLTHYKGYSLITV